MLVGFTFAFTGLADLILFFNTATKIKDFGDAWVGSAVEYSVFLEFGTIHMEENPHWRLAIAEVTTEVGNSVELQGMVLDDMMAHAEGGGQPMAPLRVALMIERRVKKKITQLGLIDSGNYRGSVATGRTEGEAFDTSATKSDPSTIASSF